MSKYSVGGVYGDDGTTVDNERDGEDDDYEHNDTDIDDNSTTATPKNPLQRQL